MTRILALALLLASASAGAQGLGDAAAQERARRAKQEKAPRVITNVDLDAGRPPETKKTDSGGATAAATAAEPATPAPSHSEQPPESEPLQDRNAPERSYLDAISNAQARVAAAEARLTELNGKLNPQSTTFIYGATGSNSANEEVTVRNQLNALEAELTSARQDLDEANSALAEARRRGKPR